MRRHLPALLAIALLAAACTSDDDDADPPTTDATTTTTTTTTTVDEPAADSTTTTTTTTEPRPDVGTFEADASICADLILEVAVECGFVVVPADHEQPDGEQLRVAVAVLASTSATPAADPVVYLEGGPGGNAIDGLAFGQVSLFEELLVERDVVVVDQRGVGRSDPALDCPELDERSDEVTADPDRSDVDEDAAVIAGLEECFERFRDDGIDPAWFTTPANADDLDLVREALGIDEWNLFGISYGTRLGLELLRRHPGPVRSAVLDSVLPPEAEVVFGSAAGFEASFEAVASVCSADPDCAAAGSLADRLEAAVTELDAAPVSVEVVNPLTFDEVSLFADGDVLLGVVAQALYDPTFFIDVPALLADLEAGGTDALTAFLAIELANRDFLSGGMFVAVACADEVVPTDPSIGSPSDVGELWVRAIDGVNVGPQSFAACEAVGIGTAAEGATEPVVSDVATLVLSGDFDPITPPSYGRDAAEDLSASFVVEHPFLSHATASDPCVAGIVAEFVDDPTVAPDTSCVDAATSPDFTPVGLGDLTLESVTAESSQLGPGVTADVPASWIDQDVGFGINRARLQGILDPTSISVLPGLGNTMDFLVDTIVDELDDATDEEPVDVDGQTWERVSGGDRGAVVDLFVRRDDPDGAVLVVIAGRAEERDELVERVGLPLLASVEVEG
ncbi:MAG: alpha/beta fold hydrolase [Actinomycetota bacterium]